jgi:hypothetical protein
MQQPALSRISPLVALTSRPVASAAAAALAASGFLYWFLTAEPVVATLLVITGMTIDLASYALDRQRTPSRT